MFGAFAFGQNFFGQALFFPYPPLVQPVVPRPRTGTIENKIIASPSGYIDDGQPGLQ